MPGTEKAKVLLSDASVDKLLLKYGGPDVEGVYLLHPLRADLFNKKGYIGVGEEAYSLAAALINNVHEQFDQLATDEAPLGYRVRRWLGLHRVSDARRAVAHYMATAVHNKNEFLLPSGTITMVQDEHRAVIRKEASFHVWRIDHNNFVQIQ